MSSRKLTKSIIAGAAAIAVAGGSYGIVSATSSGTPAAASDSPAAAGGSPAGGGGSNARSGPAAGGASGTVASVSTPKFTLTTAAGQKVTVDEAPSTTYQKGTSLASASAITAGEQVLVLGTASSTTITATHIIVQPASSGVDRVVKLGNGEYEVHYIGVNWPHHIFVNQNFKVIGAD